MIRVQLSRAKGWRMPPNTVRVCRPGPFGNPWVIGQPGRLQACNVAWNVLGMDALDAVITFRDWLERDWIIGPSLPDPYFLKERGMTAIRASLTHKRQVILNRLPELRGKNLACWCKPGSPCHADVLLDLANKEQKQ